MAWKKKTNQERETEIREYTEKLENGIREVFAGSDQYKEFLVAVSNLHGYSDRNIILMLTQWQERQRKAQDAELPDVSYVAGFGQYEKMGRHVKRGEKGIKIFAPAPFKIKREEEKKDPATGRPMRGPDGNVLTEEVEEVIPNFKVVTVFDVSQTDGDPLPTRIRVPDIEGNVQHYELFRQALMDSSPVPMIFEPLRDGLDGFFRHNESEHNIHINDGLSQVQTSVAMVHEMSHAHLHDAKAPANETSAQRESRRNREEVEAESIAFVVCQHFGIETDANSFGYVANWSTDKELAELKASLETIKKTASLMIDTIDARFTELKKEHGIEDEFVYAETERGEPATESSVAFANDYYAYMSAHNEEKGLPRYGMDEPDVVIAEITQDILNGNIPDMRDTLRYTLAELDEGSTPPAYGGHSVDTLLRRLDGFENAGRVMPDVEQEQGGHPRSGIEQFGLGFYTFMNERRTEAGNIPFIEGDEKDWLAGFEQSFRDGYSGIARMRLDEWANDPAHGEQARVLLAQLDSAEQEIYAGWPNAPMRDRRAQFGQDLAELMGRYYETRSAPSETGKRANISADYIAHQIEVGYKTGLESTIRELFFDPTFANTAGRLYSRLAKLEPLQAHEFDLGYGHLGNGLTVWNRMEEQNGDYVTVAHISPSREISYYQNNLPDEVRAQIEEVARTTEMAVSATQDAPVFSTPPQLAQDEPMVLKEIVIDLRPVEPEVQAAEDEIGQFTESGLRLMNQDNALKMFDRECSIFIIQPDGTELIAIDREDIELHGGEFGMDGLEWQYVTDNENRKAAIREGEASKEAELLRGEGDRYGIYQIDNIRAVRYAFRSLTEAGGDLNRGDYTLMYTAELEPDTHLETLWERHNRNDRPAGREMRSLSMSDVVVTKRDGELAAYYVDDFGYKEIENFLEPEKGPVHEKVDALARETADLLRVYAPAYKDVGDFDVEQAISNGQDYRDLVKKPLEDIVAGAAGGEVTRESNHAEDLLARLKVFEAMQPHQPTRYLYYSTQRPIDIGTLPREPIPRKIKNFNSRQAVENGAFQAWGYVVYNQHLTEQQAKDYELRPAMPESHIRAAEMSTENNYNMIDGIPNNTSPEPEDSKAPTMAQLEQDAAEGKQVSIMDMISAINSEKKTSVLADLADARLAVAERDTQAADTREQPRKTKNDEREI